MVRRAVKAGAINPGVYKHIPYDAVRDFAPLGRVGVTPTLLLVHPSIPATDVNVELVDDRLWRAGRGEKHIPGIAFKSRHTLFLQRRQIRHCRNALGHSGAERAQSADGGIHLLRPPCRGRATWKDQHDS
jgi:hypothetical protein